MMGSRVGQKSLRQRLRYGTTVACVAGAAGGVLALLAGHSLHGGLLLLGSVVLLKGSVLGQGGRAAWRRLSLTYRPSV